MMRAGCRIPSEFGLAWEACEYEPTWRHGVHSIGEQFVFVDLHQPQVVLHSVGGSDDKLFGPTAIEASKQNPCSTRSTVAIR